MWDRKNYCRLIFVATVFLLFGTSNLTYAGDSPTESAKVEEVSYATPNTPTQSTEKPKIQTRDVTETPSKTNGTQPATNETQLPKNETQPGKNETEPATNQTQSITNLTQSTTNLTQSTTNPTQSTTNPTQSTTTQSITTIATAPPPPSVLSMFLVNDLQYDIFPVHPDNGRLCDVDEAAEKCVGGLAHLKSYMDTKHTSNPYSIWLNAGNMLGGDLFNILKFETALQTMQFLNFNATAVGPNVFKYGGDAGRNYLDGLKSTVISNIEPTSQQKSMTFLVGNCNVSVIGYLDGSQLEQSISGVSIKNYTESIVEEVKRIQKEQKNVSNLITVIIGSSGLDEARAIANIDVIDFVLFSGGNWSQEASQNKSGQNASEYYWERVDKKLGKMAAYVGSLKANHSDMTRRFIVGEIQLPLTDDCRIANADFNVANYSNYTNDSPALDLMKKELGRLHSYRETLTLNTRNLTGERDMCSHAECSLGNLIADAMVAAVRSKSAWSQNGTMIGLFPAMHLQPNKTIPEVVTVMSLYDLIAQDAYIYSIAVNGPQLKAMLEISINCSVNANQSDFLHVSELLRVVYNEKPQNNSRITSIESVAANSASMILSAIDTNDTSTFYNISVPLTLLEMDSYKTVLAGVYSSYHPVTIVEAVTNYINNTGYLLLPLVGTRLMKLEAPSPLPSPSPPPPPPPIPPPVHCESHTGTTVIVTLVVAALIIGGLYFGWRYIIRRYRPRSGSTLHMINLD